MRYRKLLYNINDLLLKIRNLHTLLQLYFYIAILYVITSIIQLLNYPFIWTFMKSFFL